MSKETIIEKITYTSSSQSISYREIYQLEERKIKLEIKSDGYKNQCYARAYFLKESEWILIYIIPYSLMKTPENLYYHREYKNTPQKAEPEFKLDIEQLKKQIETILF
jgi:hypothetical protein